MKLFSKEVGFALTVGASIEISKLCPDNDISRIGEALGTDYVKNLETTVKMMLIMNKAHVGIERLEGRQADEITEEEVLLLTPKQIAAVTTFMMESFNADTKGEIETESKKEKGAEGN